MAGNLSAEAKSLLLRTLFSLEKRLIGALLLIALCIVVLQIQSNLRGSDMQIEGGELSLAAGNVQRSHQIETLVDDFRLATNARLSGSTASHADLIDIAVAIGDEVNALRLARMPVEQLRNGDMSFDELSTHIDLIAEATRSGAPTQDQITLLNERNQEMVDLASQIASNAEADLAGHTKDLNDSVVQSGMFVTITGGITAMLIILIVFDLMCNILPAMRRMHSTIARLADGELDVAIENVRLTELQALAGPLETFRRHALAVKNLAFTDTTTGLPNRRSIVELAGRRLATMPAKSQDRLAIIVADIDRFKHINDDFGDAAGDRLVKMVGERMKAHAHEDAIVARVGGDEFALLVPLADNARPLEVAQDFVRAMRPPVDMGSYSLAVTLSAGVLELGPQDRTTPVDHLLDLADLALYAAKNEGRNRAHLFTTELETERELARALERDLSQAVTKNQLRMVYQPIHSLHDDVQEVEALVRWQHPTLGEISPNRFIPAAERSGAMVEIGTWIIQRALADLAKWDNLTLSLNLSPLQLQQDGFCALLINTCRAYNISADRLFLEVTESLSIERNSRALLTLNLLRNAGFRIALDDFGTGYSSLSMMKTFRFDRLKLDRSLIADLANNATAQAVLEAAVAMALKVGAQVVAEGISEIELIEPVCQSGCTHLQGFYFSRPIEVDDVAAYYTALAAKDAAPARNSRVA